jgi:protein SCO1/2
MAPGDAGLSEGVTSESEEPSDADLVTAAVAGDGEAFSALACRHWRMVIRTAVQIVGPDRAEDAAQDALLLAYRALPALQDAAKFPHWLSTITRFRALRLSRSESRRRMATVSVEPATLEAFSLPEAAPDSEEEGTGKLLDALNRISPDCADVLRLHFLNGVPHQAIADRLGVPVSTVKWRCFRGKELLRKALAPGSRAKERIEETCRRCRRSAFRSCACQADSRNGASSGAFPHRAVPWTKGGLTLPVFEARTGARSPRKEESHVKIRRKVAKNLFAALLLVLQLIGAGALLAREPGAGGAAHPGATKRRFSRSVAEYEIPDLSLVDQQGRTVALRQLLDDRKPVALNFFFASCGSICPVMTATFSRMRKQLGHDGDDLRVVSITIDPDQDTPEVLKAYAERFSAGPGWSFLTGDAGKILEVQRSFFADSGGKFNHRLLYYFRAAGAKKWVRLEGLADAADLAAEVRGLGAAASAAR